MAFQDLVPESEPAGASLLVRLGAVVHRVLGMSGCEFAPCPPIVGVPGAVPWLRGIVVHKGEALPLVDLATALAGDAGTGVDAVGRVLISRGGGVSVAFLVDDVDVDDGREGAVALDLDGLARSLLARALAGHTP